jgi:hypothetical protein
MRWTSMTALFDPIISEGALAMLAEKFFLYLEALIRNQAHTDGSPRVVSTSRHVAMQLAEPK